MITSRMQLYIVGRSEPTCAIVFNTFVQFWMKQASLYICVVYISCTLY